MLLFQNLLKQITRLSIQHNFTDNFPVYSEKYRYSSSLSQQNNLDQGIRTCESYTLFCNNILKFIRPFHHNIIGKQFFTRLCVGLSHLQELIFKHPFSNFSKIDPKMSKFSLPNLQTHFHLEICLKTTKSIHLFWMLPWHTSYQQKDFISLFSKLYLLQLCL